MWVEMGMVIVVVMAGMERLYTGSRRDGREKKKSESESRVNFMRKNIMQYNDRKYEKRTLYIQLKTRWRSLLLYSW